MGGDGGRDEYPSTDVAEGVSGGREIVVGPGRGLASRDGDQTDQRACVPNAGERDSRPAAYRPWILPAHLNTPRGASTSKRAL